MTLVVRAPRLPDARAVAELRNAVWRSTYAGLVDPELLAGLDDDRSAVVWEGRIAAMNGRGVDHNGAMVRVAVDVDSERIVGMGEVVARPAGDAPTPEELTMFNVDPQWTRHGIGGRMLGVLTSSRDCFAWVVRGNGAAMEFFRAHGFTPAGEERTEPKFGVPEVLLVRTDWQAAGL